MKIILGGEGTRLLQRMRGLSPLFRLTKLSSCLRGGKHGSWLQTSERTGLATSQLYQLQIPKRGNATGQRLGIYTASPKIKMCYNEIHVPPPRLVVSIEGKEEVGGLKEKFFYRLILSKLFEL